MSRSVSAPSSVTNTSPCWNGLIVPGSTFRYGSNFCAETESPRAFRRRPSEAATMPFPSAETTPPVTNTYLATGSHRSRQPCRTTAPLKESLAAAAKRPPSGSSRDRNRASAIPILRNVERGDELGAARHPLDLLAPEEIVELLDAGVRRVARHLLDSEVGIRDTRDLGKVRDRQYLRALGEPLERRGDRMGGHAADARVDLVEDEGLAAGHDGEGERDPRQLAAGRGVRDGCERETGVRPDEERRLVGAVRPDLALAKLDEELAFAHAERAKLVSDCLAERSRLRRARLAECLGKRPYPLLAQSNCPTRGLDGIASLGGGT